MTRKIWWTEFAAREFDSINPETAIAILPIAAVEQHGPHLPVGVDTYINQGLLEMLAPRIPEAMDVRILPVTAIGKSNEHIWARGTVSHVATNLIDAWTQIGLEVARAGFRKLVIVNSHGGNEDIMSIVARELRVRAGMLVVRSGWRFPQPEGLLSDTERRHGIHGGDAETSLMLHFRPDLVDMERAADFVAIHARDEVEYKYLRPTGSAHSYAWIASDVNPAGAAGNASLATAEKGRMLAEAQVAGMLDLLAEVERFPLPAA
ncbi:creatininase family protein [Devosia nitrariae]|uniref:Creatininase n=1 Tax=Devosia nitrariae TaxID=2071872 RepID=A0ABQ5W4V5_9HYPH|nr:creatininase family protein [Devosia nitrariae]GLQ54706.1 creatininase [Devosia nitrariae]